MTTPTNECASGNSVSFRAYCETMRSTGLSDICDTIYGEGHNDWETAPVEQGFCQADVGDGTALFPRRGEILGKNEIKEWHRFRYWTNLCEYPLLTMERAVFLSGAFDILEIPSIPVDYNTSKRLGFFREDLPITLIESIQTLYGKCLSKGPENCMKDRMAGDIEKMWSAASSYLRPVEKEKPEDAKMREYAGRLQQLKNNFAHMQARVEKMRGGNEKFHAAIAPYINGLPENPNTESQFRIAIGKYRQMVKLAIIQLHETAVPSAEVEKNGIPSHCLRLSNPFGDGDID